MAHELGVEVDLLEEEVERSEHRVVDREKADPKRDEAVCGTLVSDTLLHIRIEFGRQDTATDPPPVAVLARQRPSSRAPACTREMIKTQFVKLHCTVN